MLNSAVLQLSIHSTGSVGNAAFCLACSVWPSLCLCSFCAQFHKKSPIKPLPLSSKSHEHFNAEPPN